MTTEMKLSNKYIPLSLSCDKNLLKNILFCFSLKNLILKFVMSILNFEIRVHKNKSKLIYKTGLDKSSSPRLQKKLSKCFEQFY